MTKKQYFFLIFLGILLFNASLSLGIYFFKERKQAELQSKACPEENTQISTHRYALPKFVPVVWSAVP